MLQCSLPASWDGTWFINAFANSPPTAINSTTMDCEDDLDMDDTDTDTEVRCKNKLHGSEIHFSWFRNNYKPSDCPFRDVALQFSYRKSSGSNCTSPISHASSCLDRTKLQLQYEACHEVENSERKVQHLTCLGDWKAASGDHYFVADTMDFSSRGHGSLNDRLRCFVFKEITIPNSSPSKPDVTVRYEVGTSESATCQGLHSPESGETILHMNIQNVMNGEAKPCSFPPWFASHKWMDMGKTVEFHLNPQLKNRSIHIVPRTHSHIAPNFDQLHRRQQSSKSSGFFPLSHSSLVCKQKTNISVGNDNHVAILGKYTIGEICLHLIRRSEYLLQVYYLEQGDLPSKSFREKCFTSDISNLTKGVTMISTSGIKKDCPNPGKYTIVDSSADIPPTNQSLEKIFSMQSGEWAIACSDSEAIEVQPSPNDVLPENFSCMDGWEENNVTYTVLEFIAETKQASHTTKLSCMISKNSEDSDSPSEPNLTVTTQDCVHVDFGGTNSTVDETYSYEDQVDTPSHNHRYVELIKYGSCVSENESPLISPAEEESNADSIGSDNDNVSGSELGHSNSANSAATTRILPKVHAILISLTISILLVSSH
ncbi:hypothetical protein Ocin01_06040 [Orchesella cincta]|uniref:DUF7042 domain-containing protein n=1 Tax=Orchesella cincta TaxID=48709 RepID=A0A1D2N5Y7_ORCCI|nr:hypothetical protein Ocin01_06040 [Orchesella cincta]